MIYLMLTGVVLFTYIFLQNWWSNRSDLASATSPRPIARSAERDFVARQDNTGSNATDDST